jgi:hypothetical protein
MSNRTLIEINHDLSGVIERAPAGAVEHALLRYLRSASKENAAKLADYGIKVFGMRHHSEGFEIKWGTLDFAEQASDT